MPLTAPFRSAAMTQGAGGSCGQLPNLSQPLPRNTLCPRDRKGHPGPAHLGGAEDGGCLQVLLIIFLAGMDDQCDVAGVVCGELAEGTNNVVLGGEPAVAVRTGSGAGTARGGGSKVLAGSVPQQEAPQGPGLHSVGLPGPRGQRDGARQGSQITVSPFPTSSSPAQ